MKEITTTIYMCEYCKKKYLRKHHAKYHEDACTKNPLNHHRCYSCEHFVSDKRLRCYADNMGDYSSINGVYREKESFYCNVNEMALITRGREIRGQKFYFDECETMTMPKECDKYKTDPDLPV